MDKITSIKPASPPRSGDLFTHPRLGSIKLIRPFGGDSWLADVVAPLPGVSLHSRVKVRPSSLSRDPSDTSL